MQFDTLQNRTMIDRRHDMKLNATVHISVLLENSILESIGRNFWFKWQIFFSVGHLSGNAVS